MISPALSASMPCTSEDFELVKKYIHEFELDDRGLKQNEFLTLSSNNVLVGFARLKRYTSFSEICSLGVITTERLKGIGKKIVLDVLAITEGPLYLVCIIPSFFETLGFSICKDFPGEIGEKLEYCSSHLPVAETYFVMKRP